jgi:hypothetical protein
MVKDSKKIAQQLAKYGFSVFPIAAGKKSPPLWPDWPKRATRDIPSDWPEGANVGIHCAGMIAVDIDYKKPEAEASMVQLDLDGFTLPDTLTAHTPTGGKHLFYALPAGHPGVPNRVDALGKGIDIRSTGGYVVAAGSETEKGTYKWDKLQKVAPAPQWLIDRCGQAVVKAAKVEVPDGSEDSLTRATEWLKMRAGAVEGQGGDAHTFQTAAFLRDFGLSRIQAFGLMQEWNHKCSPPWADGDLWAKVVHAYSYAKGEPGAKAVTADEFPVYDNEETAKPAKPQGKTLHLNEFARSEARPYLVKGLLDKGTYTEVYGAPGAGKTFVALDIAYHVAAGRPWMGRKVKQGVALYLAYEGTGGLRNRAQALVQHYGTSNVPFYFTQADFNLRELAGRQALGAVISSLPDKPALIVIDTLAHALCGGDENSAQDVSAFNRAVQTLIQATGATVVIIHHSGKDKTRGARGSSALQGAIDSEICIDGRVIWPTKQRDIGTDVQIGFRLHPIVLGVDEDGDVIESCVVMENDILPDNDLLKPGSNQELGFRVLCQLRPNNEPIRMEEWKTGCKAFLGNKSVNKRFFQLVERLKGYQLIEVKGEGDDALVTRVIE